VIARAFSLVLAVVVCSGLMLLPAMRGSELTPAGHGLLPPLMMAASALFVHGLGYRPRRRWSVWLLSPWLLWPLTVALAALWWQHSAVG